jgi:hypothetical protein
MKFTYSKQKDLELLGKAAELKNQRKFLSEVSREDSWQFRDGTF